jgi:RecA/RadA recombinase
MMFHYRGEYPGRSDLSERAERLNIYMYKLRNLAQTYNIAVVITNQSTSNPDKYFKDLQPFGGKVISNTSAYIVYLERASSTYMFASLDAKLVKGLLRGYGWHPLRIVETGFKDIEPHYIDDSNMQSV